MVTDSEFATKGHAVHATCGIRCRRFTAVGLPLLAWVFAVHAAGQEVSRPAESAPAAAPVATWAHEQASPGAPTEQQPSSEPVAELPKRGLILSTEATYAGYTLFAPLNSTTTYLVDMQGKLVHSWPSKYVPGQAVYLLDDGSLLRTARQPGNRHSEGGGIGGRIERLAPDGKVLWDFVYADEHHCQHHDIKPLPNGHVLLIAWEKKTREQAIAAGRDPEDLPGDEMWPDCVIEVEPEGTSGGNIVWEWHVWDHLVQSLDKDKPNYGVVAEHPELVDLNYQRRAPRETPAEIERLRSLGYVGGDEPEDAGDADEGPPPFGPGPGGPGGPRMMADWCHTNSIDYNAKLDQIALSVHTFNEIWIIDHSTTTQEAAGHAGGRYGKGGDLLYRWGNPRAYGAGGAKDQTLFAQHDARWIPEGYSGSGHLLVFNNGTGRPGEPYSSIVEFAPPIDAAGRYRLEPGKAYEPAKPSWEYAAGNKTDFFASHISGAQRLPNGNTLICSGEAARIFEVTAEGKTVWDYVNPYFEREGPREGFGPFRGPPRGPRFRDRRPGDAGPDRPQPGDDAGATPPQSRDGAGGGRVDDPAAPGGPDRPPGPRGRRPPGPPGGGPWGPPEGPGGDPGGGVFRATRLGADHPGVRQLLEAIPATESNGK
ncbi:MAG TPA: aryl-sulfate sulfotransferase [Phycisphaerae bacterium]|nr:aryl-sulfate sulfotransferase [Phycisphaerae bacterium]HNU46003.1 aryl-sulfate sulfotransferase [Phycisphaerae bacterium]